MTKLAYEARGAGPALVLLHAFPFDRRMWAEELAAPRDVRRVVAVDLRGFGESPLWGEPTVDDLADDVIARSTSSAWRWRRVCGMSMGGYVALSLAERHRARLAALVLADTRAAADSEVALRRGMTTMRQVRNDGTAAFLDGVPERMLSRHASDDLRQRVRDLCADHPRRSSPRRGRSRTGPIARRSGDDRLPDAGAVRRRRHDLAGARDALAGAQIPDAEYVEIAGVGHLSNLEAPRRFDEAVARFLAAQNL